MKLVKKILIVHAEARLRRRSVMMLAAAGFDVRTAANSMDALKEAKAEWVDMVIIPNTLPDRDGRELAEELRRIQPTLLVMLTVPQVNFTLAYQSVKVGIVDVIPMDEDPAPMVSAVCTYFGITPETEVSAEEFKKAEAVLDCIAGVGPRTPSRAPFDIRGTENASEMVRLAREHAEMETQLERALHERKAFESQLKTLLGQGEELRRMDKEAVDLKSQRELIEVALSAISGKNRQIEEARSKLSHDRERLDSDRAKLDQNTHPHQADEAALAAERHRLKTWQLRLTREEEEVRAQVNLLSQEKAQLAVEKRNWHRDLETLREQEANLRHYETRLRDYQARMEAERILPTQPNPALKHSSEDPSSRDAWIKIQRASDILEAEKSHIREDRLALRDWELNLKNKEEQLAKREKKLAEAQAALAAPVPKVEATKDESKSHGAMDAVKNFTMAPFSSAAAVFKTRK